MYSPTIKEIKTRYRKLDNKKKFIEEVCEAVGRSHNTVRHHWFSDSGFWSVPRQYQSTVLSLLKKAA